MINSEGVKIIIGPISSANALAMIPVTEAAGVLLLSPSASSPEITGKGKLFFRTSVLSKPQGRKAARYIFKTLKSNRVSIFYLNDETGRGYTEFFEEEFVKLGGTIAVKDSYEKTAEDFSAQIPKFKDAGAEVIYVPAVPRTLGLIIKQAHELGYDPIFITNYGSEGQDVITLAGDLANDRVFLTSVRISPDFIKNYRTRYRKEPEIFAPIAYDALSILAKVIADKNSTDPAVLETALRSLQGYTGASGKIAFDKNGDPVRGISFRKVANGAFQEL